MASESRRFDFIKDGDLRRGLEADHAEMLACAGIGAWKSVHVLGGSIVEAVLVEHLLAQGNKKPDPLKMTLDQLIDACGGAGVLSDKTVQLSGAVKAYRNLIHPGRVRRLDEVVDEDGAVVVQSLVSMIVREVSANQAEKFGLNAEQLLAKFATDETVFGIADHVLREVSSDEIERLLLDVLPAAYFAELEFGHDIGLLDTYGRLFRECFGLAPEDVCKKVMAKYVKVLKEESGARVETYEQEFFRATDLAFVSKKDRDLVKAHLLSRLKEGPNPSLLRAADGIGTFLEEEDVVAFVDPLVRECLANGPNAAQAKEVLEAEAVNTPGTLDPVVIRRLEAWQRGTHGDETRLALLEEMKSAYEFFALEEPEDSEGREEDGGGDGAPDDADSSTDEV